MCIVIILFITFQFLYLSFLFYYLGWLQLVEQHWIEVRMDVLKLFLISKEIIFNTSILKKSYWNFLWVLLFELRTFFFYSESRAYWISLNAFSESIRKNLCNLWSHTLLPLICYVTYIDRFSESELILHS